MRIERDTVKVSFALPSRPDEEVTALTVRWHVPFSRSFAERDIVEALIRGFVDRVPAATEPKRH